MKQHTTPVLLRDDKVLTLEKVLLNSNAYDEKWIQNLCFENPSILPVEELEPTFGGMIPICKELSTESGYVDLIYLNEYGFITIGECKLWRNPEARRKVIGQVLDYAKDMAKWNYSKFETECLKARKENNKSLFEIVQECYPDIEEHSFIDSVQKNLKKGRFLISIIGDGIRENMEELANYIHRNGNLNFTLCLIELPVYQSQETDDLIITPRIIAKTKEIERIIYKFGDQPIDNANKLEREETVSQTISEKVFFERLETYIGTQKTDEVKSLIETLKKDLNIVPKLGRGKRLSLNLKSWNDNYNFGSIQEDGEVWFYGIVETTGKIGDKQIGINYLKKLANIVGGEFDDHYKEWFWCVKKNGKYINIKEYLKNQKAWKDLISDTLDKIEQLEENQ